MPMYGLLTQSWTSTPTQNQIALPALGACSSGCDLDIRDAGEGEGETALPVPADACPSCEHESCLLLLGARLSEKIECKKFVNLPSDSPSDVSTTLRKLLWRCIRSADFARQRDHVAYTPVGGPDLPPEEFLLARKITRPRRRRTCGATATSARRASRST